MANHAALKRLQVLRDKLELKRDDIAVSVAALEDEARELDGRQGQLSLVRGQIESTVREIEELGRSGRAHQASADEFAHEELALRHSFGVILDQGLKELKEERQKQVAIAEQQSLSEAATREVSVLFEDEEAVFRVVDSSYTFDFLIADACRFFELHPLDVELVDENDNVWLGDKSVRNEMAQFDNQYGRIILRMKAEEEDGEEAADEDADQLMQLLLGKPEELDDDDEDEEVAALQQQAASGGVSAKEVPKKKLNRKQLFRELPVYLVFSFLFIYSLFARRNTESGYYQVNAIRTILIDENFGDFNEKAFADIRNFEEVFEWIESVIVDGIYPDGKYNDEAFKPREVGAVMTYNRVVGGIRLRTVRSRPGVGCPNPSLNKQLVMNSTGHIYTRKFVERCYADFCANEGSAFCTPSQIAIGRIISGRRVDRDPGGKGST